VLDLLLTLGMVLLLTVGACLVVLLLGVLPFVIGTDAAERRGFSPDRWGAVCLLGVVLGALVAFWTLKGDHLILLLLPAAALCWAGPALVSLLDASQQRVGGTRGSHLR
jgi:hypothetical protein